MSVSPDLVRCADEPIRVPGAIQPHGWMAAVSAETGELMSWSDNWPSFSYAQQALAGANFRFSLLIDGESPASLGHILTLGKTLDVSAHRRGGLVILEFEPASPDSGLRAPIYQLARHLVPQLQAATTVQAVCQLAAAEMKRLTGYGRCLVYAFHAQTGHGDVLAEAIEPGYESYQDHCFPADDIPAQARELYRLNHIRVIPDANYQPASLLCVEGGHAPPIDLTMAGLRSVSPVHLEYMRNMGTLASMSVSIVVRGRLWGLVSCHNHDPRHLSFQTRVACEHLGRLLSMQIEAKEDNADVAARLELRRLTLDIVGHLADSDATLQRIVSQPRPLLQLAEATGAAVVLNDECWTTGDVPEKESIVALAQWIAALGQDVYETDSLAQAFPALAARPDVAAGVLAISISQVHRHVILWFRTEIVRAIQWAGDPRKEIRATDGRIHPRRSFASWKQLVHGRSAPWMPAQSAAALELRQALIGVVLRRAEEMAEVATELGRVNKELEAFSYTVSHDLRAPMRHIAGYVDLVLEMDGKLLGERALRYLSHVKEAAAFAGHLVDALLDFSRMGRSALKRIDVDTQALVDDLVRELDRQDPQRQIEWDIQGPLAPLRADPFLLQVTLRNLLGNAVKYTRGKEHPRITVRAVQRPEGRGLEVLDNGVGFQMKYVDKLFGVFQRLHQAEDFEGTGIGLASVKRIVERHGGTVWAQGELNQGASFGFVLPNAEPRLPEPSQRTGAP